MSNSVHEKGKKFIRKNKEFPLTQMRVLASRSGNIPLHISAESPSNISPKPSEVTPKFQNPRTTFENTPLVWPKVS
jgi:hypothetical protein